MIAVFILRTVLFFILGAIVGSFLNLVIDRLPRDQSPFHPRPYCSRCHRKLKLKDLLPLFSYLSTRGKCRYCGAPFGVRTIVIEVLAGTIFALFFGIYGFTWVLLIIILYTSVFILVSTIDIESGIIPNSIVYPCMIVAVILFTVFGARIFGFSFNINFWGTDSVFPYLTNLTISLIGAATGFIFLLIPALVPRSNMGMGDVKLSALIGLMLGFPLILLALFFAVISGGLTAIILLLTGMKKRQEHFPYGPFLCLGALVAIFWGNSILNWYLGFPSVP